MIETKLEKKIVVGQKLWKQETLILPVMIGQQNKAKRKVM